MQGAPVASVRSVTCSGCGFLDGPALVVPAVRAGAVGLLGLMAVGALGKRRLGYMIVGAANAGPALRVPAFWVRHNTTPLVRPTGQIVWAFRPKTYCFLSQSCLRRASGAMRGSKEWVSQRHSS